MKSLRAYLLPLDYFLAGTTFRKIVARAGIGANLDMPIHLHMLRHSTGLKLVISISAITYIIGGFSL